MRPSLAMAPHARSLPTAPGYGIWLGVLPAFLASVACPARAQLPDFPTLEGAGVEYISQSGYVQLLLSGQLDLEGMNVGHAWDGPDVTTACDRCHMDVRRVLREGDGALHNQRLRVFADLFVGDHVYGLAEVRGNRGGETFSGSLRARIEQLYVRLSTGSGDAGIQAGRFATPFGSYPIRHLTSVDPFITPPLAYEYRTVMNRWRVPGSAQALLTWKDEPEALDLPGSPSIWEVPYQWGAMLFGRIGPFDLRAAAMNSAPSSGPPQWKFDSDQLEAPSWVFSARVQPTAALELGASYNRGPWMQPTRTGTIQPPPGSPPGTPAPGWRDFDQELISADISFSRGATMLRAEAILDRWQTPNVADTPTDLSLSFEAQRDLMAGLFVAARFGMIDFSSIDDGAGGSEEWDYDVVRYEGAVGYRLARNVGVMVSAYDQRQDGAIDGDTKLFGVRLWWAF